MSDLTNRTVTIERTFNAPIETVWDAWTQPDHIVRWWGPKGAEIKVVEHDFKPGGKWKYTMPMPNGAEFVSEGTYKEIIVHEKIVTSADFRPMTQNVELIAAFKADGDQTHFTFSVVHETEEYRIQQEQMGIYNGWGSAFDRLEAFVTN